MNNKIQKIYPIFYIFIMNTSLILLFYLALTNISKSSITFESNYTGFIAWFLNHYLFIVLAIILLLVFLLYPNMEFLSFKYASQKKSAQIIDIFKSSSLIGYKYLVKYEDKYAMLRDFNKYELGAAIDIFEFKNKIYGLSDKEKISFKNTISIMQIILLVTYIILYFNINRLSIIWLNSFAILLIIFISIVNIIQQNHNSVKKNMKILSKIRQGLFSTLTLEYDCNRILEIKVIDIGQYRLGKTIHITQSNNKIKTYRTYTHSLFLLLLSLLLLFSTNITLKQVGIKKCTLGNKQYECAIKFARHKGKSNLVEDWDNSSIIIMNLSNEQNYLEPWFQ